MEIKRYFEMPNGDQFPVGGIEYTKAMYGFDIVQYTHIYIRELELWIRIPSDMVEADQIFIQGQEYWIYREVAL